MGCEQCLEEEIWCISSCALVVHERVLQFGSTVAPHCMLALASGAPGKQANLAQAVCFPMWANARRLSGGVWARPLACCCLPLFAAIVPWFLACVPKALSPFRAIVSDPTAVAGTAPLRSVLVGSGKAAHMALSLHCLPALDIDISMYVYTYVYVCMFAFRYKLMYVYVWS